MNLQEWICNKSGVLSVDADFFTLKEEQFLAPLVVKSILGKVADGATVVVREEHIDLLNLVTHPIDFVVNFDYHMDCRLEFLHGQEPRVPACNASLFENLLATGLIERYIWAFPSSRGHQASVAYASAFATHRQPLLARIHCLSGQKVLNQLLDLANIHLIFICRSPDYATVESDSIFKDVGRLLQ